MKNNLKRNKYSQLIQKHYKQICNLIKFYKKNKFKHKELLKQKYKSLKHFKMIIWVPKKKLKIIIKNCLLMRQIKK